MRACCEGTRYFPATATAALVREVLAEPSPGWPTVTEVANETTLRGAARLLAERADLPVAALNFASAKNPGGGFLSGARAQEESLARSSALYASLLRAEEFYARHRAGSSLLYSDAAILSPSCPVFRDDDGGLLEEPRRVSFVTCAAPNAGAIPSHHARDRAQLPTTLRRRAEVVLAVAASAGYARLVLGAWGCGVFRNDPELVASAFAEHLRGAWAGRFERVQFSVLDTSSAGATIAAFRVAFA